MEFVCLFVFFLKLIVSYALCLKTRLDGFTGKTNKKQKNDTFTIRARLIWVFINLWGVGKKLKKRGGVWCCDARTNETAKTKVQGKG